MARSILIDIENMKIVAASDQLKSAKCISILADIMKLADNYLVLGSTAKSFKAAFSFDEMVTLYGNTTGTEVKRTMHDAMAYGCERLATNFNADERTCEELEKALGRPFVVVKTPAPERQSKSEFKGTITRPKAGTVTGRVWEICDKILEVGGKIPTKDGMLLMTGKEGINPSTAMTQFGKWKATQ